MDTASIDLFWSQGRRESSWSSVTSRPPVSLHDPLPVLDLDALQVALTRLDHSPQKGKAYVGRSGALSHRRPPSRSSRRSSADSLQLLLDQQDLDTDLVIPRVVNIEVQFEGKAKDRKQKERQVAGKQTGSFKEHRDERQFACKQIRDVKDHREETDINHTQAEDTKEHKKQRHFPCRDTRDFKNHSLSFREELNDALEAKHKPERKQEESNKPRGLDARQEIRRKLFENRYRRSDASVGGSNPLLNNFSSESEESFRRIKEEVARLAAKRRSSSDISDSRTPSDYSFSCGSAQEDERRESLRRWSEERESVFDSASLLLDKNLEENRSSSEADVVISDRESIADSGLVNRRTVITINEKKSKSASSLTPEEPTTPLWVRDLQTRRSLRGKDQAPPRLIPIEIDQDFEGGINVSIVSQTEPNRKDSTSRMYVRQSDSENRPSRASAFNVRRTIEKRQIQQERRERRALREKIREQLRSLSEGRERKDSSTSHGSSVHLSQNSVRSKSMSSLDQDQEDFRSESPLFKVQSSPTLEKEKEEVRSYLFGVSNLTESGDVSPTSREDTQLTSRDTAQPSDNQQEPRKTYGFVRPQPWQWTQSWDSLKTAREEVNERKSRKVSKSVDSVQNSSDVGSRQSSFQSSILELGSSKPSWQDYNLRQTEHRTHLLSSVISPPLDSLESTSSCPPVLSTLDPDTAKRDNLSPVREEFSPNNPPVPPPRRNRLSSSTGQITLEEEDKPNWIRLAKERRSLRAAKQVDQLSDRASTASKEPEWVARARKKLESLNVTLTSTTDFSCASSCVTESSSAWSRGGLDALDDLKEETSRIGEELAEEASARVNEELGLHKDSSRMLEHNTERSREPSAERPRVSFEPSATEASDGDSSRRLRTRKPQKDEVRFGDLKHDWGGAQTKATKTSNGKQKEMRFGEIQVKETLPEPPERTKAMRFGDHVPSSSTQKAQSNSSATNGSRPVMRFGDTPLNLFPASEPKGPQSSSKFESVAGPDPTKMTAEQLNQNVEEYDFPIPTGNEDASELMRFLEESLKRTEVVPEVVILEDHRPKPKSILKRRSVENVLHELKREERGEVLQKVEHRKSASFDWDSVEEEQRPSLHTASSNPSSTQEDNTSSTTPQIGYRHQTPDHFDDCPGPSTYYHHDGRTTFSSHHGAHASFNHHRGSHASFTHHEGSHVSFTHHEGSHASSLPRTEGPTTKLPAKMFSFTFSADQKTRPETFFTELEEDSLVHLKTQKEVENIRRTEGMKTFTVITNPRDVLKHDSHSDRTSVNGHVITPPMASHTPPMASHAHLSKSKSNKIGPHSQKLSEQCAKSSGEVPIKPYRMKTTSQSHTSGGERRKIEDKAVEGSHHKHKVHQVTVEVVNDEDQRKISSKRREEERRRSSLLEWEALQRQRLEDEEKNRINKNLSMKPVSTKIKELVKMHGSFMSMFSKDKKTDINGTVDGKDDIVFRKMSSENLHSDLKNDSIKEIPMVPMKSPYIVKKLLSPTKHTSSYEESQRRSRRDSSKSPTRRSSSATRKDSSKTRASEDKKDHTSHRILTESNWKNSATNRPTTSAIGQKLRSSSSPSSRRRKTPITSSSPDRSERSREKDTLSKPRGSHSAEPRASESRLRARDRDDSSKSSKKFSPPVPPKPINLHEKTQSYPSPYLEVKRRESADREKDKDKCQTSFSFEKRMSEGRSSIKDPKNRKEWLNKMLNTLSSEQISSLDRTSPTSPSAATATPPLSPSKLRSNRNIYRDSLQTEEDPDEMLQNFTPVPPARRSTPSSKLSAKPQHSTPTKYTTPSTSIASPKASASSSIPVTPIKPAVPPKYLSTFLAMSSTDHVDITCASKTNASFPSTPTSLRSSVREALQSDQSQVCNGRRGPVSLSSILGDCSSRSSSMTSTPLTSPRATPERVLKRDSLDLTSKLDVILESSLRDGRRVTVPGDEHKENIAPSPSTKRNKEPCEKDIEEKESSNVPLASSFTSSFRLRDRSEERRRGTRREDEDRSPQREIKSSWQPSVHKPFTFTKPSVTLKAMTSGVDPQRVATSKTSSLHKDNVPHTSYLSSCLVPGHHDNKKYSPDKNNSIVRKSEVRDNPDSFTSRYAHERLSLRGRVPESPYKGATENSSAVGGEGRRLSSKGYEPLSSRFSKERSSLRSREPSERSTPDRDTGPVSLSTILSKDDGTKDSPIPEEPSNFQFKPNLSFSEEMNDLTHRYRTDMAIRRSSSEDTSSGRLPHATTYDSDDVFDNNSTQDGGDKTRESSLEPQSKESSPAREVRVVRQCKNNKEKSPGRRAAKESSPSPSGPKGLPKTSSTSPSKSRSRVVRRNSSLKRYRPEDQGGSVRIKKERKDSEDDPADHKDETIVQNDAGWTKTKTTVRRARLGSSEKARQIVRTNSGKTRKEKTFKANASKDLEDWAAGTSVQGKLMKKEGQKFSHETEEEVKGGQRTSKSVVRRVVRRGSRRLSGGGELLTETKETSSTGASKDGAVVGEGSGREGGGQEVQKKQEEDENEGAVVVAVEDGVSRRMKTKTDGERYMTQSVCDKGGRTTYTTEGVNNKTTNSLEVIGGDDFDAKREVQGRTGHRVVVERTKDNLGRPSTVVKKITSQSRVVITKTKRKLPVVV
ncbi:uncharacterized protein LOC121875150 isoform X2 [Homarus americanus]|uniref:uncharacterized protein LOC121875150 isoform X2 n=1 Tax=Homarus americanus TaxID=6706 RepID=UPI001C48BD63|nr:uncharacterized protein LOC121875150 isoform X2 [Homarus americanus]